MKPASKDKSWSLRPVRSGDVVKSKSPYTKTTVYIVSKSTEMVDSYYLIDGDWEYYRGHKGNPYTREEIETEYERVGNFSNITEMLNRKYG